MGETVKVNLDRTYLFLRITGIIAGALIACAVVYGQLDNRMDKLEKDAAVKDVHIENLKENVSKILTLVEKIDKKQNP